MANKSGITAAAWSGAAAGDRRPAQAGPDERPGGRASSTAESSMPGQSAAATGRRGSTSTTAAGVMPAALAEPRCCAHTVAWPIPDHGKANIP